MAPALPDAVRMPATCVLFGLTYLGLAAGRVPGSRIDRAGIALVGATAVLAIGALSPSEAARAVDYHTLILLFGMMIVAAHLWFSGAFALATDRLSVCCRGPRALLAVVIGLSGVLSALLVNDVVCVALTPLVLDVCRRLRRPPLPYLIGLATAVQRRLGGDPDREPAKHDHRVAVGDLLRPVRRPTGAVGTGRAVPDLWRHPAGLSRSTRQDGGRRSGRAAPSTGSSDPARQVARGLRHHVGPVLRRLPDRSGGAGRRRRALADRWGPYGAGL